MFKSYLKPGKGVEKRDPNKGRFAIFFELFFRKFWSICKANILYLIACIPAFVIMMLVSGILSSKITDMCAPLIAQGLGMSVAEAASEEVMAQVVNFDMSLRMFISLIFMVFCGMGPATAGLTYVLRNYAREEHVWLVSDMWQRTKSNFRQGMAVWIVDLLAFVAIAIAFDFYINLGGAFAYIAYLLVFVVVLLLMMHLYIYQLMVTFELKLKDLYKNALIFAFVEAPRNFALLIVLALIHIGIPFFLAAAGMPPIAMLIFILLELVMLVAASGFVVNYFIYPSVERFIVLAQQNEEAVKTEDEGI